MPRYLSKQKWSPQKGEAWHYQMAVPKDLRGACGRAVITRYVGTCCQREA
jgi:hypothetical protein